MATSPLVSVHMITYNHAPYIAQAIEGVLKQEVDFPIELVIGEDCSTDGTRDIVLDYQKRYPDIIRVVTSEANVGMQPNCRRTYRACRGTYITYCEGDDYWHNLDKLKKQVQYLESHPDCGLVHTDLDIWDVSTGKRIRNRRRSMNVACREDDPLLPWWILCGQYPIWTCTVCAKKKLVDDVYAANPEILQDGRFLAMDLSLWSELSRLAKVHYIPEIMATYQVLAESASHSNDFQKHLRFYRAGTEVIKHFIEKRSCPPTMQKIILRLRFQNLLHSAYWTKNAGLAKEIVSEMQTFGISPSVSDRIFLWGLNPVGSVFLRPVLFGARQLRKVVRSVRQIVSTKQ